MFLCYNQGVWNIREKETTWLILLYDYTCFEEGTSFEKKLFKVVFLFFKCCFYYNILNKTDFLYYKKIRLYCQYFCIPKKLLFRVIQPFFCVYNNLF